MTDKDMVPALVLRQYIYGLLKANDPAWEEDNYGGKVPIVPLGEEADIEQYSGPKAVYIYGNLPTGTMYMRGRGSMGLAITDNSFRRLTRSMNVLHYALNRLDETARDISVFLDAKTAAGGPDGAKWNEVQFGTVHVASMDGGEPAESEGGDSTALITIEFDYFVDYSGITTIPPV